MPSCHVLLVDDDPAVLRAVGRVLEFLGHHVERAESIRASLARLRTLRFDVVVSDVCLDDGSVLDVIEAVDASATRVVALADDGAASVALPAHVRRAPKSGPVGELIAAVL